MFRAITAISANNPYRNGGLKCGTGQSIMSSGNTEQTMEISFTAKVAELVDALVLDASGATRESSSLSFRTIRYSVPMQEIIST